MRLYAGMSREFIQDTVHNQIAGKLADSFFRHFRYKPPPAEVNSWNRRLSKIDGLSHTRRTLHQERQLLEYER